MKLEGRRQSTNVSDRRGGTTAKAAGGIGIGGIIIYALFTMLSGGDASDVLQAIQEAAGSAQVQTVDAQSFTEEEQELAVFASQILAGTVDVWSDIFSSMGKKYIQPTLVLISGSVNSGCGYAPPQSGPFYCSGDQCVYLDLSFFTSMKQEIGADGDFAYAYVIAHEVGHHVQYLLGDLQAAHNKMNSLSEKESNKISVRLELQADFYAGVWAYNDNKKFGSLEAGDVDEGLAVASKIGDDYLQRQAYGYTVPDSFNHGTSAQRSKWLKKGLNCGDWRQGDTFSVSYDSL